MWRVKATGDHSFFRGSMTRDSQLLHQLFVVTLFFVSSQGRAVDIEDFWSSRPTVQSDAILRIEELTAVQHNALNNAVMRGTFTGRTTVIIALLKQRGGGRDDLIRRLLHQGAPSEVVPTLIDAIKASFNLARPEAAKLHLAVVGPSSERAAVAAYSLSLLYQAKQLRDDMDALYRTFGTNDIPRKNLKAILSQMTQWEMVPRQDILAPFLKYLCEETSSEVKFEAAVLRLKLYGYHEVVEGLLRPIALSASSHPTEVISIAKALLSTPSLAATDIEMLILLLENPNTPDYLKGALSWRWLRHRRLVGVLGQLDPRWQGMLMLLDDPELDESAGNALIGDLAAYFMTNRGTLTPLDQLGDSLQPKSALGKRLWVHLELMTNEGRCANEVAVPLSDAIPKNFLQAILF